MESSATASSIGGAIAASNEGGVGLRDSSHSDLNKPVVMLSFVAESVEKKLLDLDCSETQQRSEQAVQKQPIVANGGSIKRTN